MCGSRPWAAVLCCIILLAACGERLPFFETPGSAKRPAAPTTTAAQTEAEDTEDISLRPDRIDSPKPIVVPGNDRKTTNGPTSGIAYRELEGDRVTLNFINASLPEVAQAILSGILQVNYFIDPEVDGEVTLETTDPIPRDALLSTFETVLKVNDAALVRGDDMYQVVPLGKAPQSAAPLRSTRRDIPGLPGFRMQVVPLAYVSAADMKSMLEPVAPAGGVLHVDAARNILLLAGTRQDMRAMLDVVAIFDVDWLNDKSFGIYPVEYADAATMVGELQHVLGDELGVDMDSVLRFVSIDRLNAVLAISPNKEYVERVGDWISRLDRSWNQNDQRIFVYPVQNGKSADLAAIINELFVGTSTKPKTTDKTQTVAPRLEATKIGASDSADSASDTDSYSSGPAAAAAIAGTTITDSGTGKTSSSASKRTSSSRGTSTGGGISTISGYDGLRVISDDANNSLVILATPAQYRTIETTLRRLDVVPLQVFIEATIAEILLNDDLRYGVQWFFETGRTHQLNLSTIAGTNVGLASSGFSYFLSMSEGKLKTALDLLAEISEVKVISSPHLMVLGNQSAHLQVGDEVPILTRSSTSTTDPDAPIVNEVEYRNTGVILTVTPRVNPGGLVTLEIEQEASSVAETTIGGTDSPTIQQRKISSTVSVQSGESIALGGMIRDDVTKTRNGIPILSDIPVIGNLFGRTSDLQGRTELIIVLTPRVVASAPEAARVTQELRARLKGLQKWDRLPF